MKLNPTLATCNFAETQGRAGRGLWERAAAAILHIQVLVKCSAAQRSAKAAPHRYSTDACPKQRKLFSLSGSALVQPCHVHVHVHAWSPYSTLCIYMCVCVHREGTCSVPQKRRTTNIARQTSRGHPMIAPHFLHFFLLIFFLFFFYFRWPRVLLMSIVKSATKCDV